MTQATDVLAALPVAVYTTDPEGRITYFNEAAATLWGHRPQIGSDKWCGSWKIWWPDGRRLPHEECPMAVMLKEGRAMPGVEAVAERPNGTRVPFAPYPSLLKDKDGRTIGAINVLVDLTDRQAAHFQTERLAAIVASSDDAIISKTLDGTITSWNAGACRIFGYSEEEMLGQSILRLIPEHLRHEEVEIISRLKNGERIDHFDTERVTKSGKRVYVSLTVSPIRDRSGRIVGASKVARDITDRKRDEVFQQLLVEELNHRVKNTLAIVQSVAAQSLRKARDSSHFVESFTGRVQALARAHDLLVKRRLSGSTLRDLVAQQVILNTEDARIKVAGPDVVVGGRDAIQLALVLHELATNARKYGALAPNRPTGRLAISWSVEFHPSPRLQLKWKESGVEGLAAPERRGFGSTLIQRSLSGSGGSVSVTYLSEGLESELLLPLEDQRDLVSLPQNSPRRGAGRVLIIEDEAMIAMDMEETLIRTGFDVVGPVATVESALDAIAREDLDAALLDANLNGSSVEAVAVALTRANIPFAFATGHNRQGLPEGFGSARLLAKPFSDAELIATLAELVRPAETPLRAKVKPSAEHS